MFWTNALVITEFVKVNVHCMEIGVTPWNWCFDYNEHYWNLNEEKNNLLWISFLKYIQIYDAISYILQVSFSDNISLRKLKKQNIGCLCCIFYISHIHFWIMTNVKTWWFSLPSKKDIYFINIVKSAIWIFLIKNAILSSKPG